MMENILEKIDNTIDCYEDSRTDENNEFVDGVIYGLTIAKASIQGAMRHEN